MRKVLILGGRAPVALDHARRFAAQGWVVHVADSVSCNISTYSKCVANTWTLPSPRFAGAAFIRQLTRVIQQSRVDVIVPTGEEVFFLARYRSRLPREIRVVVDEFEKLERLHSKYQVLQEAGGCGAGLPISARVRSLDEARDFAQSRPIVLKPEFSRFGSHVRVYPEGIPANEPALPMLGSWIAQQYCPGRELSSYSIARNGRLLAHATYEPRYRVGHRSSFYFEPTTAPAIEACVSSLVAKLAFDGQISFDWICGDQDRITLLECNPRATSGLHLFATTSAIPNALNGEGSNLVVKPILPSPRMHAAAMLTYGFQQSVRTRRVGQWLQDFNRARDVVGVTEDWRPVAGTVTDHVAYALAARRNQCSVREAANSHIEWDGDVIDQGIA